MRRLIAIFILAIFAFNVAGYQLIYNYMAAKSDAGLELAIDQNNYNSEELISIKQPTNLPYYTNSSAFQRIDGEVEVDGVKYKYVKCRIYNDSLEMLCIPNKSKMQIEQSKNNYAKVAHDFQQDTNKKKSGSDNKFSQKSLSEYEEQSLISIDCGSKLLINNYVLVNSVFEENRYFTTEEHPPDSIQS